MTPQRVVDPSAVLAALVLWLTIALFTSTAAAQQASGIAGVVRDTSGAVLPGVTVEASSPALIEKVRSVVTDQEGRYNIVDLRPGTYVVTFTLPGFSTFRREGITLTAGFTATVGADMAIGALEETITVTGAAPLVDTQNVRQQRVVSTELLAALPSGSMALQNLVTLTPGMNGTPDVGGSSGLYRSNGPRAATYHGKAGVKVMYDGMNILASGGTGASNGYLPNPAFAEETTIETGGISAESSASGIMMNVVPKTGANTFSSTVTGTLATEAMHADNLTEELRQRGVAFTSKVLRLYDMNVSVGGPIRQDRLWFFASGRKAGNKNTVGGQYFNKTQGTPFFTPDLDRPQYRQEWVSSVGGRLTWQASEKNKVSTFSDVQGFYNRGRGEFVAPEASGLAFNLAPQGLFQVSVNSVRTSRLLLEGGVSYALNQWPFPSPGADFMRVSPTDISILEASTGFRYNAKSTYNDITDQFRFSERFTVAYVTGSHSFKAGIQMEQGINNQDLIVHGDVNYTFLGGMPNSITQYATPYLLKNRMRDLGLFAQDQWTIERLTVNYGLRFDYFSGYVPAQEVAATRFVPARAFDRVDDVPSWTDLNPRVGASYDLFGNGRTALKFSLGRYLEQLGAGIANDNNPIVRSVLNVTRTWNDANGDYRPDCDLTIFAANGECGPINNQNFGKNNPNASRYDEALLHGFARRTYAWDLATEVQHQLLKDLSLTAGYYRNWAGNFRTTDNLAVTPADYTPFCITAPRDPRLPGGGGYEVCGMFDVAPAKFGQISNLVTKASPFIPKGADVTCDSTTGVAGRNGAACGRSDFFGVSVNARLESGMQLGGGVDTGRTVVDRCFIVDSPQELLHCRIVTPFKAQTQIKAFGSYPLPGGFTVSGTFQNLPGASFQANYPAPNVEIAPSLGRDLAQCGARRGAACTATVQVPLIPPMTQFLERRTQLDLRIIKQLELGQRARLQAMFDIYNVFNASTILAVNSAFGPAWQRPTSDNSIGGVDPVLPGRLLQVGAQLTF
jgi:hypothetical protein